VINDITEISYSFYIGTARCSTEVRLAGVTWLMCIKG
jgi:hypothetical protein